MRSRFHYSIIKEEAKKYRGADISGINDAI